MDFFELPKSIVSLAFQLSQKIAHESLQNFGFIYYSNKLYERKKTIGHWS